MKVLTIKEPWASLITMGYKEYEFRSWKTSYRGKILIHAGKSIDKKYLNIFKDYNITYCPGAIIGEAELVDCIQVDQQFSNQLYKINPLVYQKNDYASKYAWKLINIKIYDKPIPYKGQLGLWNYYE